VTNGQEKAPNDLLEPEGTAMQWLSLGTDVLLAGIGIWLLLIGYGVIGKRNGDAGHSLTAARGHLNCKLAGWCVLTMAIIGLLSEPFRG
jgi:hypothetical protein